MYSSKSKNSILFYTKQPVNLLILCVLTLEPDTTYSVKVKAFSAKHEGNESAPTVGRTDIMGPTAPFLTNVSCEYNNSIMVEVTRPEKYPGTIDMYYIDVYENGLLFDQMALTTDKKYLATSVRTHVLGKVYVIGL